MKSSTFNYSLLAIGVAAVMGISTTASAAPITTPTTTTGIDISNQASASYKVSEQDQPVVKSNIVIVKVSEQISFSLTANNDDTGPGQGGTKDDDKNQKEAVAPNGFVSFKHTLKNTGNSDDIYDVTIGITDTIYDQARSKISYKVYNVAGDVIRQADDVAYTVGGVLPSVLKKGERVEFIIKAKTNGNIGGSEHSLEISATSRALKAKTSPAAPIISLKNTNSSFTRLPTFGIVKTITNGLDLNNVDDTAEYTIVVTNHNTPFDTDALGITIEDFLPTGIVMEKPLTATNITLGSNVTIDGTINNPATTGFNITGANIPKGQKITIVFTVKQVAGGEITPEQAKSLINHVTVTDNLDNDLNTTDNGTDNILVDSTDTLKELKVGDFYPATHKDVNKTDGTLPAKNGDDSTGPLSLATIKRSLTLTGPTFREIAPKTGLTELLNAGQVTHETVITNNGKDVEGSKADQLTFTINDFDGETPNLINIVPKTVTAAYGTGTTGTQVEIKPKDNNPANGVYLYDLHDALPNGIPANGGTVTIRYNISANDVPMFTPISSTNDVDATKERTIVTLIPKAEGAPTKIPPVEDITTVRGLALVKKQAIDANCNTIPADTAFVTTDIKEALPGQCIVYRIEARNTSSTTALPTGLGFDITDITILDKFAQFSAYADYVTGSLTATKGTPTATTTDVSAVNFTLAAQTTATMQFKVKIKPGLAAP